MENLRSLNRNSLELHPEQVSIRRNGTEIDLIGCIRLFIYRGWPKGNKQGSAKEYLELHFDNNTVSTFRLSDQQALKVSLLP